MAEEEVEETVREPLDPFGRGEGEYGGRVPYRSRYDLEREAQQAAQQPQQQPKRQRKDQYRHHPMYVSSLGRPPVEQTFIINRHHRKEYEDAGYSYWRL